MNRRRALISTIPPGAGGVPAMLRRVLELLEELEIDATVAWYEPWSRTPGLSVPTWRAAVGRVRSELRPVAIDPEVPERGAVAGHAIGAWLPELEITHYRATAPWRALIAGHDLHLVVSGTAMAGRAFADTATPFVAWIASDWHGDRKDRVKKFPPARRLLDALVVRAAGRRLERRILGAGRILALSGATRRALDAAAGNAVTAAVLPYPIDTARLRPAPGAVMRGRIGFVGRFDDPRKNFPLFLDALVLARRADPSITGEIFGATPSARDLEAIRRRGLGEAVTFAAELPRAEYGRRLAALDLLCLTSYQEGLGIGALEAMASGCPVVATRCGGPEEFVAEGENGHLTGFEPAEIASRVLELVGDRARRERFAAAARRTVESSGSAAHWREALAAHLGGGVERREVRGSV